MGGNTTRALAANEIADISWRRQFGHLLASDLDPVFQKKPGMLLARNLPQGARSSRW